jgi:Zn-dependent protease with chaperone function
MDQAVRNRLTFFCKERATPNQGDATAVWLRSHSFHGYVLAACLASSISVSAQNLTSPTSDEHSFNTAVDQLRSNLNNDSVPAVAIGGPSAGVFEQLVHGLTGSSPEDGLSWELRVVKGLSGRAFSLPNGAVYVDDEMVQLLGNDPGLWAAVLAHEIIHIVQHHWTKRAIYQDSLRDSRAGWNFIQFGAFPVVVTSSTQNDRERAIADFSQQLELEADIESMGLMARSGFHPDFVTALDHLMEAQEGNFGVTQNLASHPRWGARESQNRKKYSAAVAEFEKLWPDPAKSPGGNPPVLAFVGRPSAAVSDQQASAELTLPIRCENSSNPIEVLLLLRHERASEFSAAEQTSKMRQSIDCRSNRMNASFALNTSHVGDEVDAQFYVMDSRGWVLARSSKIRVRY